MIDLDHEEIPVYRQCELLGLSRSSLYYRSTKGADDYNQQLMRLIDRQYTKTPFYGTRRITVCLKRQGYAVNRKRVSRLMKLMGIEAIYPRRRLSQADAQAKKYPYLLKGLSIKRPDQVWATDITYIRMRQGFIYLVAIMDWFSRYVLTWAVSITMEAEFCISALQKALELAKPEIFNSDQGSQFTSTSFTTVLERAGIKISMDGRGRVYDNIFIERLWRSVKYEEVYLNEYVTVREAVQRLGAYFRFYNSERPHQALGNQTPYQLYAGTRTDPGQREHIHPVSRSTFLS